MGENKEMNLVARRALELIKEESYTLDDYKNNLQQTIDALNNELTKENSGEIYRVQEQELNKYIEEKNSEAIYNIFKAGAKGYNMDDLINAVIQTGDADAIVASLCIWKNERITKTHFLKCAKAVVELRAHKEIVWFSKYCFGDYSGYNTCDIAKDLVKMMSNDMGLMKHIIEDLDTIKREQGSTPSCYMPFGRAYTTTMAKFRDMVSREYCKQKHFQQKSED